jgi:hypothetical protein
VRTRERAAARDEGTSGDTGETGETREASKEKKAREVRETIESIVVPLVLWCSFAWPHIAHRFGFNGDLF